MFLENWIDNQPGTGYEWPPIKRTVDSFLFDLNVWNFHGKWLKIKRTVESFCSHQRCSWYRRSNPKATVEKQEKMTPKWIFTRPSTKFTDEESFYYVLAKKELQLNIVWCLHYLWFAHWIQQPISNLQMWTFD